MTHALEWDELGELSRSEPIKYKNEQRAVMQQLADSIVAVSSGGAASVALRVLEEKMTAALLSHDTVLDQKLPALLRMFGSGGDRDMGVVLCRYLSTIKPRS